MADFPISFAIITDGTADERIEQIVASIRANLIPTYEILIVGDLTTTIHGDDIRHIPHDESTIFGWITGKKNLANDRAKHDVVVFLHDYHVFASDWYEAMKAFGLDWDIQMNQIRMINGHRMFDWLIFDHPVLPVHMPIPYDRHDLIRHQYISGAYWISKKHVLIEEPLDGELRHHQAEDVEWSKRVRNKYKIRMNPAAVVTHNKVHRECAIVQQREATYAYYENFFRQ